MLVSPHVGGDTSAFAPRAVALIREQLTSLVRGEPLRNVVGAGDAVTATRTPSGRTEPRLAAAAVAVVGGYGTLQP